MSHLVISEQNNILEIKLNRPEIHNAFNDELISELTEIFENINDKIRLVTITGEGKSFCAGADLNWMKSMKDYSLEENIEDSSKLARMFEVINNCPVPVLGKVNGHALGGGVGIVSVCDFVMSSSKAKFGFTEVKLGLIPAVISPFCKAKIGESNARAWFTSGRVFSATKAMDMGLVHEVVERESLDDEFSKVVDEFLMAAPMAARESKVLIKTLDKPGQDISKFTCEFIAQKRISKEGQEGMSALLEKRKANWIQND